MAKTVITGVNRLRRKLRRISRGSDEPIQKSFDIGGAKILRDARSDAPFRTGNLRKSGFLISMETDVLGTRNFVDPPEHDLPRIKREDAIKLTAAKSDLMKTTDAGIIIGFTTYYAFKVHEGLVTSTYKYGEVKFLEKALEENKGMFPLLFKTEYKKFVKKVAKGG